MGEVQQYEYVIACLGLDTVDREVRGWSKPDSEVTDVDLRVGLFRVRMRTNPSIWH